MTALSPTIKPLTGNPIVDASTNGSYWLLDTSRTLTWALSNFAKHVWINPTFVAAAIGSAYGTYSSFANIKFTYVGLFNAPNGAPADCVVTLDGVGDIFPS